MPAGTDGRTKVSKTWEVRRKRLYDIIEVGNDGDFISTAYDMINVLTILLNLIVSILLTFESIESKFGPVLLAVEQVTYLFFGVDFFLRLITARYLYPGRTDAGAAGRYLRSFMGIVDLLSFLPYYQIGRAHV